MSRACCEDLAQVKVERWLSAIADESALVASVPADALELEVPTCPGWTVRDLVGHVGAVHRWAADQIAGTGRYRGYDEIEFPDGPALIDWYVAGRDLLVQTLVSRPSTDMVSTFVGARPLEFWFRRQAGELAVHRWDLESATRPGGQRPIDPEIADGGIDEWLEVFAPRFLGRRGHVPDELIGATIHLHGTDVADAEWFLEITESGVDYRRAHVKADVALRGSVSDLYLVLWHRLPTAAVEVIGDTRVLAPALDLIHVT